MIKEWKQANELWSSTSRYGTLLSALRSAGVSELPCPLFELLPHPCFATYIKFKDSGFYRPFTDIIENKIMPVLS